MLVLLYYFIWHQGVCNFSNGSFKEGSRHYISVALETEDACAKLVQEMIPSIGRGKATGALWQPKNKFCYDQVGGFITTDQNYRVCLFGGKLFQKC